MAENPSFVSDEIGLPGSHIDEVAHQRDQSITMEEDVELSIKANNSQNKIELQLNGDVDDQKEEEDDMGKLLYSINDNPPWYLALALGLQHYLTMVGSTITIPFILAPELCIQSTDPSRGYILSTIFFVSGIVTFVQATFGVRLPIVQGGTFSFFVPTLVILRTSFPLCDTLDYGALTAEQRDEEWMMRMREIQGAIAVSSIFQIIIGYTGLIGVLVTFITPLAIVPTVCLVGLSLFDVAATKAASNWYISGLTIVLMVLFSQYLRNVPVPFPIYKPGKGFSYVRANLFGLFPVLLSILLSWALCGLLTVSGALSPDSTIRTDNARELINGSPWFRVPYPGQWGPPTVSAAGVFGMLAGVLASIIESIGDYYACARLSGAPPPPRHAINRGIGTEGLGCLLAGLWGTGNGTTSYSENIAAIGLTKVGSRRVIQYGAGIMIVFGVLGKFAAAFVSIPEPVVGGIFCVMFAMITAVGLSSLQNIDLNSSRNLFVLGFPIFFGLALPKWLSAHPGAITIESLPALAQIITVLLQTSMFVGGFLGILLDNTIPGTDTERGILQWNTELKREDSSDDEDHLVSSVYDFPVGMDFVRRKEWFSKIPFCPTFSGWRWKKE